MRVLVTGSSGLVGRVVVTHLARAGHDVVAFDLDIGLDLRSLGDIREAVEGAEAIVHLAAVLGHCAEGDEDFVQVNLVGTWRLLTEAVRAGVRRFVFTSSVDVLGVFKGQRRPDYLPLDDDHPCYPSTPYAGSKHLAEVLCADVHRARGIETVVLRPPGVWTEETYERIKARRAVDAAYEWSPYWEYGAFLDVRDLAAALERAVVVDDPGPRPFAVAADDINSSGPTSLEWAARLHADVPWRGDDSYSERPYAALLGNLRAKEALGWTPLYSWRPRHA